MKDTAKQFIQDLINRWGAKKTFEIIMLTTCTSAMTIIISDILIKDEKENEYYE